MAELLVGPTIKKLIEIGFEYLKDQVRWQTGMKEELERLRKNYPLIQAVVEYASTQEQIKEKNPALNEWMWQLRDAIDEADDVMDEFEYLKLKKQLIRTEKPRKVRSIKRSIKKRLVQIGLRALKIDPTLKRLKEVVHKLHEVSAGVITFLQLAKEAKQDNQELQLEFYEARETGSSRTNDLMGRGKEKETLMKWLRNPSNYSPSTLYSNISLLSVVGQGGMGKTTLLQDIYKEMKIDFDLKLWVCVSNNFNVTKVIADMLESLTNERPRLQTLDALQKNLESEVKKKKFLLVLDDIWEEEDEELNKSKWEKVLAPLASGKLGSKILMTTRLESVVLMLSKVIHKKNEMLRLEGLKDDECLMLLNRYAFANVENLNVHPNLRHIAENIVKKLSGSPLASRVIGGVLHSRLDENHWNRVLNYGIGSQKGILDILKLSYVFLPKVLQNCLSLCCTYPQDYMLDKDDLVRMWIALGFIQPPVNPGETMKDVGEMYFDTLVKKSLLDKFQSIYGTYYKLHDLIHQILRVVSTQVCFSIVGDIVGDEELLLRNSETTRHLFVETSNSSVLRKVEKFKNLRSLHLSYDENFEDFVNVLAKIFKTLRSIRLMYIHAPKLKQMPEEIGDLIHLRCLTISTTIQMPRSLSNLYHLQFMIYNRDFIFFKGDNLKVEDILPKDMNNLPNMLYLEVPFPGMHEIGKLNSLQELDGFYVQNKSGYRLEELKDMNELRVLIINFHENLEDAKDAYNAKLCNKRNLIDLSLKWDYDSRNAVAGLNENVLDNLQPHRSLKKLKINFFMGVRSAIWMNNVHLISNLEHIHLANCLNWQTLPPFWQLPFLKYLYLDNMPKVKGFHYKFHGNDKVRVFPSLQMLHIESLQALEDWFVSKAAAYECLFPCLTELYLLDCPNLQELPALPPKLKKLKICNIEWKGFNWLQGITSYCSISIQNCPNLMSLKGHQEMETNGKCQLILSELVINDPSLLLMVPLRSVTSIQKLEIQFNIEVISFPIEIEQWFLQVRSSLCELNFKSLISLQSLPSSLESLSSLEILRVIEVPLLQMLPNMPTSLEELFLIQLESLQSLPSSLESFSSLKILHVEDVPQVQLLLNMPASLEQLKLEGLKSLQFLPSLESLSSLKILHVEGVPQLQLLSNMPASLKELKLDALHSLQCLSSSLSFSSLNLLYLRSIPLLQKLPDLPPSLRSLIILDCHPELMKRYQRLVDPDRSKVMKQISPMAVAEWRFIILC